MVQVVADGSGVRLDPDISDHLGSPGDPHDVLRCWTATTPDYAPLQLIELPGGLVVARIDDPSAPALALRWADLACVTQDERAWMLLLTPVSALPVRLLFASLGELRLVAAHIANRCAEVTLPGVPGADAGSAAATGAAASAAGSLELDGPAPSPHARSAPVRARAAGHGSARARHAPRSPLARIERRLATVESLLADLTLAVPPPADRSRD